mgnify:CR=1 FL=1
MSIENEYEDRCPGCPRACPQEAPGCPRGEAWAASLSGEEGERTLQAMAATFAAYTQGLDRLSFRCQGEELTVNGKTAQDFLDGQLTITRTVETDYRE